MKWNNVVIDSQLLFRKSAVYILCAVKSCCHKRISQSNDQGFDCNREMLVKTSEHQGHYTKLK